MPISRPWAWVMPLLLSVTTAILLIYTIPFVKNL